MLLGCAIRALLISDPYLSWQLFLGVRILLKIWAYVVVLSLVI